MTTVSVCKKPLGASASGFHASLFQQFHANLEILDTFWQKPFDCKDDCQIFVGLLAFTITSKSDVRKFLVKMHAITCSCPISGLECIFMRVIAVSTLKHFWEQPGYQDAETPLRAWLSEAEKARWQSPADIKAQFGNASILKNRRVVFNIKGNEYRIVVAVAYVYQAVYFKFVGTHEQYDAINALAVELKS